MRYYQMIDMDAFRAHQNRIRDPRKRVTIDPSAVAFTLDTSCGFYDFVDTRANHDHGDEDAQP